MARKEEGASFNPLGWMLTFSDLVTLLLTFFVMLLAMKQPEIQKFQAAFSVFSKGSEGVLSQTDQTRVQEFQQLLDAIRQPKTKEFQQQEQKLAELMQLPGADRPVITGAMQNGLNLRQDERGTVITLANDLLFAPGSATLGPQAEKALDKVAQLLRYTDLPISVEGHSDKLAVGPDSPYKDNWGLSLARADAVLKRLKGPDKIPPNRLRIAALGDTRPLVPNDSPANRAINRRTEIVLLSNNP